MSYPEDPDLCPYYKIALAQPAKEGFYEAEEVTLFQYPYGIVALVYSGVRATFVTRLD